MQPCKDRRAFDTNFRWALSIEMAEEEEGREVSF